MMTLARPILTTASLLALAMGAGAARAAESCSAYPTGTAEKIESSDLASKFGAVPKPGKELHFAYVTKNAHQRILAGCCGRREERGGQIWD